MSREGKLIKNTAIITVGKICTQMISFFLLPLYTAILSTEEYGTVDLLNTIVSLVIPLITLQIEHALFRFLIDNRDKDEKKIEIISTTLITLFLQSIAYIILFTIVSPFIHNDFKFFLATNVIACMFSSVMLQIARGFGDNKNYAIASFLTALFTIIFNILFIVIFKFGAYGMLTASLLANIICCIYILLSEKLHRYIKINKLSKTCWRELLKYSIPLIPNSLSWWVFNASDRLIVSTFLGIGTNGILAAAHKFPSVFITIYNIFNLAWTETAALHIKDKDKEVFFENVMNTTLKLFTTLAFSIIVFMPFVFKFIINEKFGDAYYQIPILTIASIFNVILGLLGALYIANKDTKTVSKTSVISACINIIVHLALIKFIGLYAASISTLVAYFSVATQRYFDINKRLLKFKFEKKFIINSFIVGFIFCLTYYINNTVTNLISIIIFLIYAVLANYKSLDTIKKIVLNKYKRKKS